MKSGWLVDLLLWCSTLVYVGMRHISARRSCLFLFQLAGHVISHTFFVMWPL